MRRLILVKHSLPEILTDRPRREWQLSDEGRLRAARLASRLRSFEPERIASSPEPKAQETAAIVAGALGDMSVKVVDGLREHDDLDVPFLAPDAFRERVRAFFARPGDAIFGPETADAAYERFAKAIYGLAVVQDGRSHVAVAHGRVISLFVARKASVDPYELWLRLGLPSIVTLRLPGYEIAEIIEAA